MQNLVIHTLQDEYARRCQQNPRYSLRAFAKYLEIDVSTLSQILRGKRKLSKTNLTQIQKKLGAAPQTEIKFYDLTADAFAVISEWYPLTILEMFGLRSFKSSPKWIAQSLGITVTEAQIALERLERLEMIRKTETGVYKLITDQVTTIGSEFTTAALRRHQRLILEKALHALDHLDYEERDQSGMAFRFPSTRLPEAREKIKKFRRELCKEFENDPACDSVFQLSTSFFPLTQRSKP